MCGSLFIESPTISIFNEFLSFSSKIVLSFFIRPTSSSNLLCCSSRAVANAAMPGTSTVPALLSSSCLPPWRKLGNLYLLFMNIAPTPFGPPILWADIAALSMPFLWKSILSEIIPWTTSEWKRVDEFTDFISIETSFTGWITPVSLLPHINEATLVLSSIWFKNSSLDTNPFSSDLAYLVWYPFIDTHSADAKTASCSIFEVTRLSSGFFDSNKDLIVQLSASVPPLVNMISLGAALNNPAIFSLESSNKFFESLDNLCPPEEFANPKLSASTYFSNADVRIGVDAAWSRYK